MLNSNMQISFVFFNLGLFDKNRPQRGLLGVVQRLLAHLGPNGALVADFLDFLRTHPANYGRGKFLALAINTMCDFIY